MKRRDFLKTVACASTLAAGEAVSSNISNAFASANETAPKVYSTTEPGDLDLATFDFYVEHKTLLVASTPIEADRAAEFELTVNPISFNPNEIIFTFAPIDAPEGFACSVTPERFSIRKSGRRLRCRAVMPAGVPEGREAVFKIIGARGREEEEVVLRLIACASAPRWELGHSKTKVSEQPLKITAGEPVRFHLSLANTGHLADDFILSAAAPQGWNARLTDEQGRSLSRIRVGPVQGLFQWEKPEGDNRDGFFYFGRISW